MKINAIDNLGYVVSVQKSGQDRPAKQEKRSEKDSLELSQEARRLSTMNSSLTPERLDLIRKRISEDFYNQDEIIDEIANRMLNSNVFQNFLKSNGSDKTS
jgi:hypothetical protein